VKDFDEIPVLNCAEKWRETLAKSLPHGSTRRQYVHVGLTAASLRPTVEPYGKDFSIGSDRDICAGMLTTYCLESARQDHYDRTKAEHSAHYG
jgi:hypothetical protein